MGKNFRDTLNERMKDPSFLAEWNAQEPERQIMRAIAEGREEKDMTQKQLADASGVNIRQLQRIENGEGDMSNVTLGNAVTLAAALGVDVKELL